MEFLSADLTSKRNDYMNQLKVKDQNNLLLKEVLFFNFQKLLKISKFVGKIGGIVEKVKSSSLG